MGNLTDLKIKSLVTHGKVGLHTDGDNLHLRVTGKGNASWIFRQQISVPVRDTDGNLIYVEVLDRAGKPVLVDVLGDDGEPKLEPKLKLKTKPLVVQKGIDAHKNLPLAKARIEAAKMREALASGADPSTIGATANKAAKAKAKANAKNFRYYAQRYIADREERHAEGQKKHRSKKHMAQWPSSLEAYAYPIIGDLLPKEITFAHIVDVASQPGLKGKDETKYRVNQRIKVILDEASEYEQDYGRFNPAARYGPKLAGGREVENHPAAPWKDCPAIYAALATKDTTSAYVLRWTILTAARSMEARGALWAEIEGDLWSLPPERMKMARQHIVPLSTEALGILKVMGDRKHPDSDRIFPGSKGGLLSDVAVNKTLALALRDAGVSGKATVHGFRSSFRDYIAEETPHSSEAAEWALAHKKGKVEGSYQRASLLTKRSAMMQEWADFLRPPESRSDKVVPIRAVI